MTSVSQTIYASGVQIEVAKKKLTSGEFIQLRISYDQPDGQHKDTIVVTLNNNESYDLAQNILTLGAVSG